MTIASRQQALSGGWTRVAGAVARRVRKLLAGNGAEGRIERWGGDLFEVMEPRVLMSHSPGLVQGPVEVSQVPHGPVRILVDGPAENGPAENGPAGNGPVAVEPGEDAVWVWGNETFRMMDDASYRDAVLEFVTEKGVDTLYLYAAAVGGSGDSPVVERADDFADVVIEAHQHGLTVCALLDTTDVGPTSPLPGLVGDVLAYNHGRAHPARVDGFNLDIEPWTDAANDWDANRQALSQQYLDLSQAIAAIAAGAGPTLWTGPTMPFWFDSYQVQWNGQTRPMNEHVQTVYDYTTLMDYRDVAAGPNGLIDLARGEVAFGDAIGKKVVVGVETTDVGLDALSFYEEGEAYMDSQLDELRDGFVADPSFLGVAIHDLAGYAAMAGVDFEVVAS